MCGEFLDIRFGSSDAYNERIDSPNLLIEGYLDSYRYMDKVLNERYFLVLGPKGSGKSAIGAKIQLLSESRNNLYSHLYSLKDFSYNEFDTVFPGKEPPEVRYPNCWEYLFLLSILSSVSQDSEAKSTLSNIDLKKVVAFYRKLKLLDIVEIGDLVKSAIKTDVQLCIPNIAELKITGESNKQMPTRDELYNALKRACYSIVTPNQHIIIIDDLDYVLTSRKRQYDSLMSLIIAANKINNEFRINQVKIKIVVLCRTDVFDNLSGTNKTKIVSDSGLYLDWYQNVANIMDTNIVKLINLRAKTSLKRDVDVFTEYFPENFTNPSSSDKIDLNSVLTWTRHTPRDAIQLMNSIQSYVSGDKVSKLDVKNGLRKYALEYFYGEIHDELKGFLSDEDIALVFQLLSSIGYRNFRFSDIINKINDDSRFKKLNASKLFNRLYECNAIGNYDERSRYSNWKYRNRYSSFDQDKVINVHIALAKALNIGTYSPDIGKAKADNFIDSSDS
ncbi:MAG: hypothetical protein RBQ80_07810 [Methanocorpusculum sp.]|nr:hypothetical protein [Methanocorpusculum sp.]